jgi:hypothetical protein
MGYNSTNLLNTKKLNDDSFSQTGFRTLVHMGNQDILYSVWDIIYR